MFRNIKLALFATAFAGCCVVPLSQARQLVIDGNGAVSSPLPPGTNTTSVTDTINCTTGCTQSEDLVISARNEGLVLIRGIANCTSVASALNNSMDVQRAECRKPYVGATTSTSVYTVKP